MRKLMIFMLLVSFADTLLAKSPHGKDFKFDCEICHTTDNWTKIKMDGFDHSKTQFPLIGQHKTVYCRKCHDDLEFGNANKDCISCHKDVHEQTVGRDCERCHTQSSWLIKNVTQVHQQIGFPLLGKHAQIDCYQCHKSASLLRFDPLKTECYDCHVNNYLATTNPSHVAGKYPKDCLECHNQNSWFSATFNHNSTGFPLTGAHLGINCTLCHTNGYSGGTPTTCVGCHLTNFNATTNPNHIAAKFSTDCQTCHNTTAWIPSTFDHSKNTTFPLTGAHITIACNLCHISNYNPIPTTCVSCHQKDYNATTNPNHVSGNYPTDCTRCHNTTTWLTSSFNHNTTAFPLTGSHISVACGLCHTNGYSGGTPTTCVGCHLTNFNATSNPNHTTAKFSTDCQTCHNTSAWSPSTFNHNTSTTFPLTGAHIGLTCNLCHITNYNPIPTTCVSCHLATYNATTNPNHASANFPTTCETCHTTTNWTTSTFNHTTYFPLTGNHNVSCTTCHTNSSNYAVFTCVTASCHGNAHNQNQGSAGCYRCHPNGRSGG